MLNERLLTNAWGLGTMSSLIQRSLGESLQPFSERGIGLRKLELGCWRGARGVGTAATSVGTGAGIA